MVPSPNLIASRLVRAARRSSSSILYVLLLAPASLLFAQSATPPSAQRIDEIERRLNEVTATLDQTQQALQQSLQEIQRLRTELDDLQTKPAPAPSNTEELKAVHEQQDALQAEIKQHDQIKVETASKYPLRITGLVLFNAFSNAGVVDDAELPSLALPRSSGGSHGDLGATLRQSVLGIEATGPHLWRANTSAHASADFFGGVSSNTFGYSTSAGLLRLRQAGIALNWTNTTFHVGVEDPLISPLAPTSYATIANQALSSSGNLWAWSPQLRVEQRVPISDRQRLTLEAGLIDPGSSSYTSTQFVSPVEASRRPGVEGRVSWSVAVDSNPTATPLVFGIASYSSHQFYNATTTIHAWAVTADWQIPIAKKIEITGEAYRGRSLGDFGGGAYKNILTGVDTVTGLIRSTGVDDVGGWSQLKLHLTPSLEINTAFGLDDGLASNFDGLTLSSSTTPLELYARNSTILGNLIFHPKTYLILSPEYRRIQSWRYTGPANIANLFTLTLGYQF